MYRLSNLQSRSIQEKRVKIIVNGWLDSDKDEYSNVLIFCPKCGAKLHKTDALSLCNILFVYCSTWGCLFAEEYEL